jgi:hypothetical protein
VDFAGERAKPIQAPLLWILAFVVLIAHPHTAVTLYVGLVALWCGVPHHRRRLKTIILGAVILAAVFTASTWPYYSLYDLFTKSGGEHYAGNRWMYVHVVRNTFAALPFILCIVGRFKKNLRDPIGLLFVALVGLYALGYISGKYALGRTIVYIMFCLHFSTADWLAGIGPARELNRSELLWHAFSRCTAIVTLVVCTMGFFAVGIYRYRPGRDCTYSCYTFLQDYTGRDSIILTDLATSAFVPSLGGKVVATRYIAAFVEDDAVRKETVGRFFRESTANVERRAIVEQQRVDFVLLNRDEIDSQKTQEAIGLLGEVLYAKDNLWLIDVRALRASTGRRNTKLQELRGD